MPEREPCSKCDDSGWVEVLTGAIWTGEKVRSTMTICDCPAGDDVRREQRERSDKLAEQRKAAEGLFEPNPDRVSPDRMKRSIHRSHRGEGFNDLD